MILNTPFSCENGKIVGGFLVVLVNKLEILFLNVKTNQKFSNAESIGTYNGPSDREEDHVGC
jgi:hypothetical protein